MLGGKVMIDLYYAPTPNGWKISIVIAIHPPVIPGWSEGPDPESRDSGFDASHRPGMTV
jgi:hypothetical protein